MANPCCLPVLRSTTTGFVMSPVVLPGCSTYQNPARWSGSKGSMLKANRAEAVRAVVRFVHFRNSRIPAMSSEKMCPVEPSRRLA